MGQRSKRITKAERKCLKMGYAEVKTEAHPSYSVYK
jgi:hypothetical protein